MHVQNEREKLIEQYQAETDKEKKHELRKKISDMEMKAGYGERNAGRFTYPYKYPDEEKQQDKTIRVGLNSKIPV